MLKCCGVAFYAARKIVLPKKDKMYRCLEFGYCPNCEVPVSRLVEQDFDYGVFVKEQRGIKALRSFEKALKFYENNKVKFGTKSNQNYCYGFYKKSAMKDENDEPIFIEYRKNFNNIAEKIGIVKTRRIKI